MAEVVRALGARPLLREVLLDPAALMVHAPPTPRIDGVMEWGIVALLSVAPAAFGVVETWSETILIAAAGTLAAILAGKLLLRPRVEFAWSWAYAPMALFIGLVMGQLIALPESWVAAIAPGGHALRARLLSDLPNAPEILRRMTLSFYPPETRRELWHVLSYAAVFVVALNVLKRRDQIRRMLFAIAWIGGAFAAL